MFGHLPELLIVLVIGLIVFGPERLPEVAHNAGKMIRDLRDALDTAMNPHDTAMPDDFETYYHEAMARSGETTETGEEHGEEWVTPVAEEEWRAELARREVEAGGAATGTSGAMEGERPETPEPG